MLDATESVFVSSTCYDLLDLRAEVDDHLSEFGLRVRMSDRSTSEFEVTGYRDSINTCLVNVRRSDYFVCILDQRYGPRLGGEGFDNFSATHLEYKEAMAAGLPVYLFARDRLLADYATWRKNRHPDPTSFSFPWMRDEDPGVFQLLEEHQKLRAGSDESNWCFSFTNFLDRATLLTLSSEERLSLQTGNVRVRPVWIWTLDLD